MAEPEDAAQGSFLVVLQHGILAGPGCMQNLLAFLEKRMGPRAVFLNAQSNTGPKTLEGIHICGLRLANEIMTAAEATPGLEALVLVCHSLGGLIARFAVTELLARGFFAIDGSVNLPPSVPHLQGVPTWTRPPVLPLAFCTLATPHLSMRSHPPWNSIGEMALDEVGSQLLLTDADNLMVEMSRGIFLQALGCFQKRIAYANTRHDHSVPYFTAAISLLDPYPSIPHGQLASLDADRFPHIVHPDFRKHLFDSLDLESSGESLAHYAHFKRQKIFSNALEAMRSRSHNDARPGNRSAHLLKAWNELVPEDRRGALKHLFAQQWKRANVTDDEEDEEEEENDNTKNWLSTTQFRWDRRLARLGFRKGSVYDDMYDDGPTQPSPMVKLRQLTSGRFGKDDEGRDDNPNEHSWPPLRRSRSSDHIHRYENGTLEKVKLRLSSAIPLSHRADHEDGGDRMFERLRSRFLSSRHDHHEDPLNFSEPLREPQKAMDTKRKRMPLRRSLSGSALDQHQHRGGAWVRLKQRIGGSRAGTGTEEEDREGRFERLRHRLLPGRVDTHEMSNSVHRLHDPEPAVDEQQRPEVYRGPIRRSLSDDALDSRNVRALAKLRQRVYGKNGEALGDVHDHRESRFGRLRSRFASGRIDDGWDDPSTFEDRHIPLRGAVGPGARRRSVSLTRELLGRSGRAERECPDPESEEVTVEKPSRRVSIEIPLPGASESPGDHRDSLGLDVFADGLDGLMDSKFIPAVEEMHRNLDSLEWERFDVMLPAPHSHSHIIVRNKLLHSSGEDVLEHLLGRLGFRSAG